MAISWHHMFLTETNQDVIVGEGRKINKNERSKIILDRERGQSPEKMKILLKNKKWKIWKLKNWKKSIMFVLLRKCQKEPHQLHIVKNGILRALIYLRKKMQAFDSCPRLLFSFDLSIMDAFEALNYLAAYLSTFTFSSKPLVKYVFHDVAVHLLRRKKGCLGCFCGRFWLRRIVSWASFWNPAKYEGRKVRARIFYSLEFQSDQDALQITF